MTGLPQGARVEFYDTWEAFPHTRSQDRQLAVSVEFPDDGASNYGFAFELVGSASSSPPSIGWQVQVFDDAWSAFADLPGLFAALAGIHEESLEAARALPLFHRRVESESSVERMVAVLEAAGATNVTGRYAQRVSKDALEATHAAERDRLVLQHVRELLASEDATAVLSAVSDSHPETVGGVAGSLLARLQRVTAVDRW